MPDESDFSTSAQPSLQQLVDYFVDSFFDVKRIQRLENAMRNAHAEGATVAQAAIVQSGPDMGSTLEKTYEEGKDVAQRALGAALGWIVAEILGVEVSATDLFHARRDPEDSAVGAAVAEVAFKALRGPDGELEPGDQSAKRFIGVLAHMVTHCWAEGIILEKVEGYTSWAGHIEEISKLATELINSLGLSRLARVALRPLAQTAIATPLDWQVKKRYRPNLLSEGEILKAFQRGDYTGGEAAEELARLGYSERRQTMLLKTATQRLSLDEAMTLMRHGTLGRDYALQNLKDDGYDQATAEYKLVAAESKRFDAIHDNSLSALVHAFVNRDITESAFRTFLPAIIPDDLEQDSYLTAVRTQRELNVRHLSHGEVIDCVEFGILTTAYYRAWLEREGYPPEEATALELRLRMRIDQQSDAEKARRELEDERAAAAKQKAEAAAARKAAIEQERALARRGPLSELTRAAVRGLVPIARVEEVLRAQYDADTVQIFVDDLEQQRLDYLAQQQKAEDAKHRATVRHVDVGDLEQAVLSDVLSVDQYRARLGQLDFDNADADLLTATLRARKADKDAAEAQRRDAAARAKTKSVNLDTFEQLVRRGARTFAQYDALLTSLGFDVAARAALTDLLKLKIADDDKARKAREATANANPAKGVTLEQFRQAVILGHATIDDFDRYLTTEHYTPQAHQLLVAELRDDLAAADAARRARPPADASPEPRALPLSTVRRAAQLGLITPADYADRLVAAGYAEDDIAIEMDLLLTEIADVQAARAKEAATDAAPTATRLSLTQMAAAVRAGVKHLEDYRALAVTKGLDRDSVNTLVRVLSDELASSDAARARRAELGSELLPKDINLAVLEQGVRDGTLTLATYAKTLVAAGLDTVDVGLLVALLNDEQLAAGG
jgi:hypothetical protein